MQAGEHYSFTLFVTGATVRSARAVANVRRFCEQILARDFDLEVVDLYTTPNRARTEQIVAAPTLVRSSPKPERRMIGDMSNRRRLKEVMTVSGAA